MMSLSFDISEFTDAAKEMIVETAKEPPYSIDLDIQDLRIVMCTDVNGNTFAIFADESDENTSAIYMATYVKAYDTIYIDIYQKTINAAYGREMAGHLLS